MIDDLPFLRFTFAFLTALTAMTKDAATEVLTAIRYAYAEGLEDGKQQTQRTAYDEGFKDAKAKYLSKAFTPTFATRNYLRARLVLVDKSHFVFDDNDVLTNFWEYVSKGQAIQAIKALREYTDLGLKDSKDVYDAVRDYVVFNGHDTIADIRPEKLADIEV